MRVELILEAIDRASGPIRTVQQALSGVTAASEAASAAQAGQAGRVAREADRAARRFRAPPPPAVAPPVSPAPPAPPADGTRPRDDRGRFLPYGGAPGEQGSAPGAAMARLEKKLQEAREAPGAAQAQLVGALATAAAIAAPVTKAVQAFSAYEKALNDIGQKADLTGAKLAAFGETIRAQARDLNMSSLDILKGVDQLAAGGMSVPDSAAAFPAGARVAVAYDAAMEDVAKTTVALVNNLKIAPAEIGKALDAMAQTGKDGQFELKDMARHFPDIGAQYAAMGQSGQKAVLDLAAALQIMRKNTGAAGPAVTNLSDLLHKMTMPQAVKAFKQAGIDVRAEMDAAMKSGKVIETVFDLLKRATGGDTSKVQDFLADKQARAGALALLQHYQEYLKIRKSAEGAGGVVDRDFETRMTLGVEKMRALQVATAELWTTLGQALAPAFLQRVDQLTALVVMIEAWVKANPQLASSIAQVATAIGGLLVVSAALALAVTTLRVGLAAPVVWLLRLATAGRAGALGLGLVARAAWLLALPFKLAWTAVSGLVSGLVSGVASGVAAMGGWSVVGRLALGRLAGLFGLLLSPLRLAAQAMLAFGAAMMTTPVGWIAAAVAALAAGAYLIYRNWGAIGPWFAALWARVKAATVAAWDGMTAWLSGVGGRIATALATGWSAITARIGAAWSSVTAFVASLTWPPLPSIGDLFDAPLAALKVSWNRLAAWFGGLAWPDPIQKLQAALEPVFAFLSDWGGRVQGALATAFDGVAAVVGKLGGVAGAAIDKLTSGLAAARGFVFGPSAADVTATAEQAAAAKAAIAALPPAAAQAVASVRAVFGAANFTSEGVAMMTTLAAGIRAGAAQAVAAARATVAQIRDHLPHSPAKVGPLSDLDRVQFGQTLALAIAAGAPKAVAAARLLAAGVASTIPAAPVPAFAVAVAAGATPGAAREPSFARPDPQLGAAPGVRGAGHGAIHLTFAPVIHGSGASAKDIVEELRGRAFELAELLRAELDRRDRAKH